MGSLFFSTSPIWSNKGLALVRIILGLLIIYHGQEVFDSTIMRSYLDWDVFQGPLGIYKVYVGKSAELVSGICLLLGLFTRLGALLVILSLTFVTFFVGHGRFWYEDQHPFMFVLFGVLFFFTGPGAWSMDSLIFNHRNRYPG